MKTKNQKMVLSTALAAALGIGGTAALAADATITVDATQPGAKISPLLYGIFYEEINRAGDGGLYAEMLENRSLEDSGNVVAWNTNGKAVLSIDKSRALNDKNPSALKVAVSSPGGGAINAGFKGAGLLVKTGQVYMASFYARADGNYGPLEVRLENRNGALLGKATVAQIGTDWKQYTVKLTSSANDSEARFVIQGAKAGTFFLDQLSLMPAKTWKNTPLRPDLAERVEHMAPAFVRFPGGCFVEGDKMANATRWKETIGDLATRPGRPNLWGYRSTDGLGAHEFFQWCEDLGSEPLYVINCGMAHADHIPMDKIGEFVQDALDLIEYANGPVTSKWGAMRAKNGHPKPFGLRYMEIGNENGGPLYNERYALFYDAIKAKYPEMKLIANDWGGKPGSRPVEMVDEHYYNTPRFFRERANMYDSYDRKGPQIYVGEYAVTQEAGKGNLDAALGEAAYMTGLERNGDIVAMASYAPLLVNPDWQRWNPNAIVFDQSRSYGTPSYWVQAMFGRNRGDVVVPLKINASAVSSMRDGIVGVGTWETQADFKDIRVESKGKVLYQSDFTAPNELGKWRFPSGDWKVVDGALRQSSNEENTQARIGDSSWGNDYTLSLKARKISGGEGFLISFRMPNDTMRRWWNLGGWGNSGHNVENLGTNPQRIPGRIETGRWYDVRIEAQGAEIKCYLDGVLVQSTTQLPDANVFGVASKTSDGKNLILKVVNTGATPLATTINLQGVAKVDPVAEASVLSSGSPLDENTFERPDNIVPQSAKVAVKANGFSHTFPANSVTVVRLKTG